MSYIVSFIIGIISLLASFFKASKPVTETRQDVKRNDETLGDSETPEIK